MELFDVRGRLEQAERAILVGVEWTDRAYGEYDAAESLAELRALADTAGLKVVCEALQRRDRPSPSTLIGSGKLDELKLLNEELKADCFLFDHDLTPAQIRNLDKTLGVKVVDRIDIILDIFAQRAQTREAKVQVELAQLEYALPRLRRAWTHLDRVAGTAGIGGVGTRGPGETQLQMDRRLIQGRIRQLRKELETVTNHRRTQRLGRRRSETFGVALVGYTNAGKSSLLNALTGERHVEAENKLFKTLDPTTRRLSLPDGRNVLLTDTVGFIRRLPHRLIAAFRATLEEAKEADLLLHVVDASHPYPLEQMRAVDVVLNELGALGMPTKVVLNKVDLVEDRGQLGEIRDLYPDAAITSAITGEGLDELRRELSERAGEREKEYLFRMKHTDGRWLSYLYEHGRVDNVEYGDENVTVRAQLHPRYVTPLEGFVVSP
ncbi:MAG: GTPase HflX [Candidatus Poribacteria bacterium]|nr:GTPase HflX [Candidatus Poribacteria bacterium]